MFGWDAVGDSVGVPDFSTDNLRFVLSLAFSLSLFLFLERIYSSPYSAFTSMPTRLQP